MTKKFKAFLSRNKLFASGKWITTPDTGRVFYIILGSKISLYLGWTQCFWAPTKKYAEEQAKEFIKTTRKRNRELKKKWMSIGRKTKNGN